MDRATASTQPWPRPGWADAVTQRPLRVAHFLPNMAVGGRERIANTLCTEGAAHGIAPILIGYELAAPHTATLTPAAPYWQLDRTTPDFAKRLRTLLADQQIDVIQAQGHIPACHLAQALKGWRDAPPSIATMHVGLQGTRRWLWPIRQSLRAMDRLTAVSHDMARTYSRLSGCDVSVVPNGIDTRLFAGPMPTQPASGWPFRFAMLSRLDAIKGHADAVAAADMLVRAGHLLELHVAGDGEGRPALEDLEHSRPWLRLAGQVGNPAEFLRPCHGFLLPSRAEGMPLALMEAMAAGLPCVVSDLPSLRAMAGNAVCYAPARSPAALATAMHRLIIDREGAARLGASARDCATAFGADTMAAAYARIYREVAKHRPNADLARELTRKGVGSRLVGSGNPTRMVPARGFEPLAP